MLISNETQEQIINYLQQCQFRALCDAFFGEKFLWTIKGTSILSGTYEDKEDFFNNVINRLNKVLLSGWKMHILDTYVADNVFIVEMRGEVMAKNGKHYNNEYCWIFKFFDNHITSVTAYYDSLLVNNTLIENE